VYSREGPHQTKAAIPKRLAIGYYTSDKSLQLSKYEWQIYY